MERTAASLMIVGLLVLLVIVSIGKQPGRPQSTIVCLTLVGDCNITTEKD